MTDTLTDDQLADWWDHPLVREAHYGLTEEHQIVDLFENLHGLLCELDERFPGLPLRAILGAERPADNQGVRRHMLEAGCKPADVDLVTHWSSVEAIEPRVELFEALAAGLSKEDLVEAGLAAGPKAAEFWCAVRTKPTYKDSKIFPLLDQPKNMAQIARELKTSRTTVLKARWKRCYMQWSGEEVPS